MRIAIIGSGISGLTSAHYLDQSHEIEIFEADSRLGGHTHTRALQLDDQLVNVDSGFIVCNDLNYPNFLALMEDLNVELRKTSMSFSASSPDGRFEYCGDSFNGLFAQRRNIFDPRFLKMISEYIRFNRVAQKFLASGDKSTSTLAFLKREGFSDWFIERLIVPQASAVWSSDPAGMSDFPAYFLLTFLNNHGMLTVKNRPQWMTVVGGSSTYCHKLTSRLKGKVHLNTPVNRVLRKDGRVLLSAGTDRSAEREFDQVIFACHSDQALQILGDPTPVETAILGAISYQPNSATLHSDIGLMPKHRAAWASWNSHLTSNTNGLAQVTYDMNRLQGFESKTRALVSLNMDDSINPDKIVERVSYSHPIFDTKAAQAQPRWSEISGTELNTHYCGAYWRWGFHEDGVWSALRVIDSLGAPVAIKE